MIMSEEMKYLGILIGLLTLASLIKYAFTGVGIWAPIILGDQDVIRALLLVVLHIFGLSIGIASFLNTLER